MSPAPPAGDDADGVLIGPTFADLYLDIYERYVRARHRLTATDEVIRREVDRRTQLLREQLHEECARNEKLAGLIEADRAAALQAALMVLPERQREAVVLRHLEGLANPEIAAVMGVGIEAVESLVARGKRGLAATLAGRRGELGYDGD